MQTNGLMGLMYESEADFTNTFRSLSSISKDSPTSGVPDKLKEAFGKELDSDETQVLIHAILVYYSLCMSV